MKKTPNERFKEFFESTTLSVRDFANEIGHPGSYRSLYAVFKGDRDPSSKLIKKVITRFPQLSYDWIFVGAGEMILPGGNQMRSVHDHEYSVQARFEQTMDRIDKIEFATNELANRIERSMSHQTEMTNVFFKKIDDMTSSHIEMKQSNLDLINTIEKHEKSVEMGLIQAKNIYKIVTANGERAEKIAKQAQDMFDQYWKSVAFAEDAHSMMKEIKEKLL